MPLRCWCAFHCCHCCRVAIAPPITIHHCHCCNAVAPSCCRCCRCCCCYRPHHRCPLLLIPLLVGCCFVVCRPLLSLHVIIQPSMLHIGRGGFPLCTGSFSREWWTAICFLASSLSLSENLHARITSGTNKLGHRNRYAAVCLMRLSAHQPFPHMLEETFGQWESRICH